MSFIDETGELPERYRSTLPDAFFRKLAAEEEKEFRRWARDNFKAGGKVDPCWHPVVRDECRRIDQESEVAG